MSTTKRMTLCALLSAAALCIFVIESQLPPILPIPGVKLGLSNVMVLIAMHLMGRGWAAGVLCIKLVLGAVFTGSAASFMYSFTGGVLAYGLLCVLVSVLPQNLLWVISALSAIAHNAGQLAVAVFVTGTPSLVYYAPVLLISAIVTGSLTGLAAMYVMRRMGLSSL